MLVPILEGIVSSSSSSSSSWTLARRNVGKDGIRSPESEKIVPLKSSFSFSPRHFSKVPRMSPMMETLGSIFSNVFFAVILMMVASFWWFAQTYCTCYCPLIKVPHGFVCIVGRQRRKTPTTSSSKKKQHQAVSVVSTTDKNKESYDEQEEEEEEDEPNTDRSDYVLLNPGFHWINPFFDQIQSVHWSAFQQRADATGNVKNVLVRYDSQFVPTRSQRFDFPPVECMTSNNVKVSVDGNLHFRIQNPLLLIYKVENFHQRLADLLDESIKREMEQIPHHELIHSAGSHVSSRLTASVKRRFAKLGLVCEKIYVQEFGMNKELKDIYERTLTLEEKHKAEMIRMEKEREKSKISIENQLQLETQRNDVAAKVATENFKIQQLVMEQEILKTQTELDLAKIKAQMDVTQKVAEAQVRYDASNKKGEAKVKFFRDLIQECNFTPQEALQCYLGPKGYEALRSTDKVVYLPSSSNFNDDGLVQHLPWMTAMVRDHSSSKQQ
jgi:regulator of protease activity HflC (stomatin/prohibitin superfamily)